MMLNKRNVLRLGALSAIASLPFVAKAEGPSKITLEKMRSISSDYQRDIFDLVDFTAAMPNPVSQINSFELDLPIDHVIYQNTLNWFTYRIQQEFGDCKIKTLKISRHAAINYNRIWSLITFNLDKTQLNFYYSKTNEDDTYASFTIEEHNGMT